MRGAAEGRTIPGGEEIGMIRSDSAQLGSAHRIARFIAAAVLLGFAFACPFAARLGAPVQWMSGLAGGALLVTAVAGACPVVGLLRRRSGA
jgi:hypothetical protein